LFEVAVRGHVGQPRLAQQRAHGRALVVAVFEQQPAVRGQVRGRGRGDRADVVEAVATAGQRRRRFETQVALAEVRVARGYVGRVAGDQVGTFPRHRL